MKLTQLLQRVNHSVQQHLLTRVSLKKSKKPSFLKILNRAYSLPPTKTSIQETIPLQILKIDIQVLEAELSCQYKILGKHFYKELISKKKSTRSGPLGPSGPIVKATQSKIKTLLKRLDEKKQQLLVTEKTLNLTHTATDLEKKSSPQKSPSLKSHPLSKPLSKSSPKSSLKSSLKSSPKSLRLSKPKSSPKSSLKSPLKSSPKSSPKSLRLSRKKIQGRPKLRKAASF